MSNVKLNAPILIQQCSNKSDQLLNIFWINNISFRLNSNQNKFYWTETFKSTLDQFCTKIRKNTIHSIHSRKFDKNSIFFSKKSGKISLARKKIACRLSFVSLTHNSKNTPSIINPIFPLPREAKTTIASNLYLCKGFRVTVITYI